jgi:6-phosphogluconolactonase (cycloisomerase 2 family)
MLSNLFLSRFSFPVSFIGALLFTGCFLLALTVDVRGGFLYVLNDRPAAANQIYGFSVNESTGVLTSLAGFPVATGGDGGNTTFSELLVIDRTNFRLYAVNINSNTISGFSINPADGTLTPLPFSPFLAGFIFRTIKVHPSGSPLIAADGTNRQIRSFNITATTVAPAAGSPYSTAPTQSYSSVFSRDGNFLYAGGNSGNTFAGFGVNPTTGVLTPLPGSPFDSGADNSISYATDSQGRFFSADTNDQIRVFTTSNGIPTAVTNNPFASGLSSRENGALHPNERFYYLSDEGGNRVGAYQIAGTGAQTTLAAVAGSPFNSGGTSTRTIVLNNAGTFLFAANSTTRNITTYNVNTTTGALTLNNSQVANSLGSVGGITGMDYLPSTAAVLNTNDSGAGSLRQAVASLNVAGGIIFFHPSVFNVPRTISLTSGQLSLNSNIQIVGTGANMLTIRNTAAAALNSRIFSISGTATVGISGMTLTGGNAMGDGGAINSSGILIIRNCLLSGNASTSFGGGIRNVNPGIMRIINSTLSGNTVTASGNGGGGIDNNSTLFVTNSTISGNVILLGTSSGGGIWTSGELTITNSTITNNSATGGGAGGIFRAAGTITVHNSIIAGNQNNAVVPDVRGLFTSGGFNLIGNVGAATGFNQTGDQTGSGAAPLNPGLVKVLAPNGGVIPTHALLPNSPAVDKGDNFNLMTDQRGFNRPFDNGLIPNTADGADIGAFERRALEPNITAPFDFDGDNRTDIGVFRPSDGSWWYSRSSDNDFRVYSFGVSSDSLAPGDWTGDGKIDIAVFRSSTGEWFIQRSEDNSFFSFPFGTAGDIAAPADYDGDGKNDAAVFRPSSATWFILNSGGSGTSIVTFGAAEDKPVPADFDGDGKSDIAVFRPSDGSWWYLQSSNSQFKVYRFGVGTDKPVQGDYTGDGKADIAVWRPSNGEWFIQRSEDNSFFSFPFGTAGDLPAAGDYDGDGKTDAAVFRPSTADWFVLRSTAGILITAFGANGDRPVPNAFVP